ncbi:MAG: sulfotransferase [Gammaproteobacteria bacterium]|nr:sulfotransferase [Gammaproteobacteria bacterium]
MQYLAILRREPQSPLALSRLLQMRRGRGRPGVGGAGAATGRGPGDPGGRPHPARTSPLAITADRAGEYRAAFQHLRRGYDAQAEREPFDSDGYSRAIDRLVNTLDASFYAEAVDSGLTSERPIFVVGMPRSGTTLTEQILASHSRVAAGGEMSMLLKVSYQIGELSRSGKPYPEGLLTTGRVALRRMGRRYLDQLDKVSTNADRITDKLPFNFMHLGVIALLFPGAKVVHCRRHPLDNCLSCYFTSFADQIRFANRLDTLGRYYLDYHRLMQHWHEVLPIEILDLQYEDMVDDTEGQVRALLDHCGLEWEERPAGTSSRRRAGGAHAEPCAGRSASRYARVRCSAGATTRRSWHPLRQILVADPAARGTPAPQAAHARADSSISSIRQFAMQGP